MRKILIVALGLASLGALAAVQPAFATKKRVCQTTYLSSSTLGWEAQCAHADWKKNNCHVNTTAKGLGLQFCYDIDVLVPVGNAAQIGSGHGMNTTFDHNTHSHAN